MYDVLNINSDNNIIKNNKPTLDREDKNPTIMPHIKHGKCVLISSVWMNELKATYSNEFSTNVNIIIFWKACSIVSP